MAKKNILLRSKKKKALASFRAGRYDEAWELGRELTRMDRLDAEAPLMCGVIAGLRGDSAAAEEYCRQALAIDPGLAQAHFNLGVALREQGEFSQACAAFEHAIELQPQYSEAMDALAHGYIALCDWSSAARVLNEIIVLWPQKAETYTNLGTVYQAMGRMGDAIEAYRQGLEINPRMSVALSSLGSAYTSRGDFEQAERCYRQHLAAEPVDLRARSNLLMLLNYLPGTDPGKVLEEHLEWGRHAQARIAPAKPPSPARGPQRRLRIGYLSPDFREHSVAAFIEPLLQHHDRGAFEVCCYSSLPRPDDTTLRLKDSADLWRDIDTLSDADTAQLIRADGIDILVDLAGHTGNNRLEVFAARPAPLQMTYLGYPNTTGLRAIDYRITDGIADPAEEDVYYSERLLRLDRCFLCYRSISHAPPVTSLPAAARSQITFGSFNNFSKLNPAVLELWARVLEQVSDSRLLLKCPALTDTALQERVRTVMQGLGVGVDRLVLLGHTPTREEHLALYGQVDIGLDTFPYNGTTTTCEALWMGVPVLSLAGARHAGRVGASLLTAAGLGDWIADSPQGVVRMAAARAADPEGLAVLRAELRERVSASPLCDGAGFTRSFERALTQAWAEVRADVAAVQIPSDEG